MKCPKCQSENAGSGRFCRACGAELAAGVPAPPRKCPSCGADVKPGSKFCASCAAPLAATPIVSKPAGNACAFCGAELQPGARFCKGCGKPVQSAGAAAAPPVPVVPPPTIAAARLAASEAPTLVDSSPVLVPAPPPPPKPAPPLPPPAAKAPAAVLPPIPPVAPTPPPHPGQKGGNHGALIAILALLVVAVLAAGYWFVLMRKPKPQEAAATPVSTAPQSSDTAAQAVPETPSQPSDAADANQQPASSDGSPATSDTAMPAADQAKSAAPPVPKPSAPKPSKPNYTQAHEAAQQALSAGRIFEPTDSSALFWARKAKAQGDPAASQIEQQIFTRQMSEISNARQSHDYERARADVYQLASNFPDHAELRQLQDDIHRDQQTYTQQMEDQRRKAEEATRVQKFAVQHRHGIGNNFCTGIITVNADGSARYDCSTPDNGGRCEHVSLTPGLKEAKLRGDGSLHVATRQAGNFDFVGGSMNLKDAATALAPLVGK